MDISITYKKLSEIKPYGKNPRRNDEAVDKVLKSIQEFGFKVPIVIDKNGIIVAGHTRVKAAKKLGMTEVPCVIASDLTDDQVKAFRLADNKVAELAEWDFDMLNAELSEIQGFDMSDFGFYAIEDEDYFDHMFDPPETPRKAPEGKEEQAPYEEQEQPSERQEMPETEGETMFRVIVTVSCEEEAEELIETLTEEGYDARRW